MKGAARVSEAELHAFADGQLSEERALTIAVWLADNPFETARIEKWRAQNEALRRAFPPPERDRPTLAVRASAPESPPIQPTASALGAYRARQRRRRAWSLGAAFALGAATAAAITAASLRTLTTPEPPQRVAVVEIAPAPDNLAARAADAWRTYAQDSAHPIEIDGRDPKNLLGRLHERTGLDRLPAIAHARLLGGRVLPARGHNAAFLLYQTEKGEKLALMAEQNGGVTSPAPVGASDIRALTWSEGGFDFALVGPAAAEQLRTTGAPPPSR